MNHNNELDPLPAASPHGAPASAAAVRRRWQPRVLLPRTLRVRLLLVLMVALAPMVGLSLYFYSENRLRALQGLEHDVQRVLEGALRGQAAFTEQTHQLLRIMSRADETTQLDSPQCSALARRLLDTQSLYVNIGAADVDGRVVCNGQRSAKTVSVRDRGWFRRALSSQTMTPGYYLTSRTTGLPAVTFGLPVFDEWGGYRGALFASSDRKWLLQLLEAMELPPDWTAAVVSRRGNTVVALPGADEVFGDAYPRRAFALLFGDAAEAGSMELMGQDLVTRRFVFAPLVATGSELFVVMAGDTESVTAPLQERLYLELGLIATFAVLSFLGAWFGITVSVLRWSERMQEAVARFGRGELDVRVGEATSVSELNRITRAFHRMARQANRRDIERQRAEAALRESQERFGRALSCAGEGIWDWDLQTDVVYYSSRFKQLLGYSPDDAAFRAHFLFRDCLHPEDRKSALAAVHESLTRNIPFNLEYRLRRRDGSYAWFHGVGSTSEVGGRRHFAGAIRDITEMRQAQRALRDSDLKFRAVFEQTYEMVGLLDTDGTLCEVNHAALNFIDAQRPQVLGRPFWETEWWRHDQQMQSQLRESIARAVGGETVNYEAEHVGSRGRYRVIDFRLRPITGEDGRVAWVVAEGRDITEKKKAEEQQRLAATVFESSRDAIVMTDANSVILAVNRAYAQVTGYDATAAVGMRASVVNSGRQDAAFYEAMWREIHATGSWRGEIWNRRRDGAIYPAWLSITAVCDAGGAASHYIGISTDLTEFKQAEEHIRHLAYHDPLTGLPNRTLLADRAGQAFAVAQREGKQAAVVFVDVDNFKTINDSLGHSAGDALLKAIADRLHGVMRESDTVARIGGDEFVILVTDPAPSGVAHIANRLLALSTEPYCIAGHWLTVTVSMGVALFPIDGHNFEVLLQHADTAMFGAKHAGRNRYHYFTQEMNAAAIERLTLEEKIRTALQNRQFQLHYQPQVDIESRKLIGLEALVRWPDPDQGWISPARFIPVAEQSGLIVPLGEWVLEEACRQARAWQAAGLPAVRVAINLSAVQFRHGDIEDVVARVLDDTGLEPQWLELELTEGVVMEDTERTLATLRALKGIGVMLSIDDFGTGYSSLGYLKRFPLNKLKIDQSFVRDITGEADDLAIARAVISMGHSLRLQVIAEGVETAAQWDLLRREGCDEAQGYYFGKPMPADQIADLLSGRQPEAAPAL